MDTGQVFTVKETADKLKVNSFSIYRWIGKGQIKTISLGRHIRIPGREMARIMAGGLDAEGPQGQDQELPIERRVGAAIIALEAEIKSGALPTARIAEAVNRGVDARYQVDVRAIGKACARLGLGQKRTREVRLVTVSPEKMAVLRAEQYTDGEKIVEKVGGGK